MSRKVVIGGLVGLFCLMALANVDPIHHSEDQASLREEEQSADLAEQEAERVRIEAYNKEYARKEAERIEATYGVNNPTHKGMGLVIQIPISGQTTIGGLTAALSFRKSSRIFTAAL